LAEKVLPATQPKLTAENQLERVEQLLEDANRERLILFDLPTNRTLIAMLRERSDPSELLNKPDK
jgi:hypothetical protein